MMKKPKKNRVPRVSLFFTVFDLFIMSTFSESGFLVEVSSGHVRTVLPSDAHPLYWYLIMLVCQYIVSG